MNKIKSTSLAVIAGLFFVSAGSVQAEHMDPELEKSLVRVCKAAASNQSFQLKKSIDSSRIAKRTIALNVMCNNTDIISFAEDRGAEKTAYILQKSIGRVNITDVAALSKINVSFEE